jgi:hypothetical protein
MDKRLLKTAVAAAIATIIATATVPVGASPLGDEAIKEGTVIGSAFVVQTDGAKRPKDERKVATKANVEGDRTGGHAEDTLAAPAPLGSTSLDP